jgi:phage replication O-like protein O
MRLCILEGSRVYLIRRPQAMPSPQPGRFVRFSTELLEALLRIRLTGIQWRVVLWVVRYTDGWNRVWTPFTWYRMAKELGLDRPATYRAGQALLRAEILILSEGLLAVQHDDRFWDRDVIGGRADRPKQLWMPELSVAGEQRPASPGDNAIVADAQRKRCQEATVFRRAKDNSKDRLKTYKETAERRLLAGAARPIPGKYDGLSQN